MDPLEHIVRIYGRQGATETLYAFLEQLPVCCIIKDEALRYCLVNRNFSALLGLTPAEMLGRRAAELFPADIARRFEHRERRVIETGCAEETEETVVDPDGVARHFIAHIRPMSSADGRRFVCVSLSDVTELDRARQAAKSADRLKSEFLATMSHELRTPMHGVLGLARLLRHGELGDRQSGLVDTIINCGESLMTIIGDILDFSTLEAGQVRLNPEPFELFHAVEDVVSMMTPEAEEKGLRLFIAVAQPAPARVVGDVARLKQILSNFIANAVKFSDAGEIRVEIDCASTEDPEAPEIRITVADQGIGIKPADQEKIFAKFSQVDGSLTRTRQGIGLGLAISASLAELMAGSVSVASRLGEGAAFTLAVPMRIVDAPRAPKPFAPLRVAVIDTCDARRDALVGRLAARGVEVVSAGADLALATLEDPERTPKDAADLIAGGAPIPAAVILPMTRPLAPDRSFGALQLRPEIAVLAQPVGELELDGLLARACVDIGHKATA